MKKQAHKKNSFAREKPRFCDPAACEHCEYIGDGDFICTWDARDPIGTIVVSDWEPTAEYLHCKRQKFRRRERK